MAYLQHPRVTEMGDEVLVAISQAIARQNLWPIVIEEAIKWYFPSKTIKSLARYAVIAFLCMLFSDLTINNAFMCVKVSLGVTILIGVLANTLPWIIFKLFCEGLEHWRPGTDRPVLHQLLIYYFNRHIRHHPGITEVANVMDELMAACEENDIDTSLVFDEMSAVIPQIVDQLVARVKTAHERGALAEFIHELEAQQLTKIADMRAQVNFMSSALANQ